MRRPSLPKDRARGLRDYVARRYRAGDEARILELFHRAFELPPETRTLRDWRWLYHGAGLERRVALVENRDSLLAHYAGVPLAAQLRGARVTVTHCIDSMVDPRCRGLSRPRAFLSAARRYYADWGDREEATLCNYGFPNELAYRIGSDKLAYATIARHLPTLFFNGFEQRPPAPLLAAAERFAFRRVERFDARSSELWRRVRARIPFSLERDASYLNWRYTDCPARYEQFELLDGERLRAIAIYRAGWCQASILALVDLVAEPDDREALGAALGHGIRALTSGRHTRFETWFAEASPYFVNARACGMRAEPTPFTMVSRIEQHRELVPWLADNWHYTIGDSDVF